MAARAAGTAQAEHVDSYERNIRLHVLPVLGNVPLQRLAPEDLDGFYGQLLSKGGRDDRGGLSHKTVRYIHGILPGCDRSFSIPTRTARSSTAVQTAA